MLKNIIIFKTMYTPEYINNTNDDIYNNDSYLLFFSFLISVNTPRNFICYSVFRIIQYIYFKVPHCDQFLKIFLPLFFIGMVLGSYFWGCLADTKGRKIVLVSTLLIDGVVGVISSFVQILPIFMACRFINGFS